MRGQEEGRIIVSADSDFGALLALQEAARPSFIFFREPNSLRARDYFEMLAPVLESLRVELAAGCVVVFRNGRIRLRRLPLQAER